MTAVPDTLDFDVGSQPTATIVVLHGLGANGGDFVPFVQDVDLGPVGAVRWVFPNAPLLPVTLNGGYVMPAWFDIRPDRSDEDVAGLARSQASIEALLAREVARGVPARRIVLGGFSQGCALALLTGLRYPQRLAGVFGLSGYLPRAGALAAERSAANADVPVFLAHGREDEMVVLPRAIASRDVLLAQGYPVQWHDYPIGHSVCPTEVADLRTWLRQVLAR